MKSLRVFNICLLLCDFFRVPDETALVMRVVPALPPWNPFRAGVGTPPPASTAAEPPTPTRPQIQVGMIHKKLIQTLNEGTWIALDNSFACIRF